MHRSVRRFILLTLLVAFAPAAAVAQAPPVFQQLPPCAISAPELCTVSSCDATGDGWPDLVFGSYAPYGGGTMYVVANSASWPTGTCGLVLPPACATTCVSDARLVRSVTSPLAGTQIVAVDVASYTKLSQIELFSVPWPSCPTMTFQTGLNYRLHEVCLHEVQPTADSLDPSLALNSDQFPDFVAVSDCSGCGGQPALHWGLGTGTAFTSIGVLNLPWGGIDCARVDVGRTDGASLAAVVCGAGTLQEFRWDPVTSSFAADGLPAGYPPSNNSMLGLGDLDGDGDLDAVLASFPNGDVHVLLRGVNSPHYPSSTTPIGFLSAAEPRDIRIHDFNCDGNQDIAITCITPSPNGWLDLFLGDGTGSFPVKQSYQLAGGGTYAEEMACDDFNQDGMPDIAVVLRYGGKDGVAVLLNCAPTITNVLPNAGCACGGDTVTLTGTGLANATQVLFGAEPAQILSTSATSIQVSSPKAPTCDTTGGAVDVSVIMPLTSANLPAAWRWLPNVDVQANWNPGGTVLLTMQGQPLSFLYLFVSASLLPCPGLPAYPSCRNWLLNTPVVFIAPLQIPASGKLIYGTTLPPNWPPGGALWLQAAESPTCGPPPFQLTNADQWRTDGLTRRRAASSARRAPADGAHAPSRAIRCRSLCLAPALCDRLRVARTRPARPGPIPPRPSRA